MEDDQHVYGYTSHSQSLVIQTELYEGESVEYTANSIMASLVTPFIIACD